MLEYRKWMKMGRSLQLDTVCVCVPQGSGRIPLQRLGFRVQLGLGMNEKWLVLDVYGEEMGSKERLKI